MKCTRVILCCHPWPAPLYCTTYSISTLCHKRHKFRKTKVAKSEMCVLIISATFIWNISYYKKNWPRYDQKCISVCFMSSTRHSCQILMKLEFCGQIFEKYTNIKFNENPSRGSRVVPCWQTYRQTDRQAGGRADMRKLNGPFLNFAKGA